MSLDFHRSPQARFRVPRRSESACLMAKNGKWVTVPENNFGGRSNGSKAAGASPAGLSRLARPAEPCHLSIRYPALISLTGLTGFTRSNNRLQRPNPENSVNPVKLIGDKPAQQVMSSRPSVGARLQPAIGQRHGSGVIPRRRLKPRRHNPRPRMHHAI